MGRKEWCYTEADTAARDSEVESPQIAKIFTRNTCLLNSPNLGDLYLSFIVLVRPKFVIGIAVPFCSDGEMIFLHPPSIAWKLRPVWCLVRVQAKLPLGRPPLSTEKAVDYGWRRACGRTWLAGKSLLFPQHKHLPRIVRRRGKVVVCWEPIHTCFRVEGPIPAQILCQIPMLQN